MGPGVVRPMAGGAVALESTDRFVSGIAWPWHRVMLSLAGLAVICRKGFAVGELFMGPNPGRTLEKLRCELDVADRIGRAMPILKSTSARLLSCDGDF